MKKQNKKRSTWNKNTITVYSSCQNEDLASLQVSIFQLYSSFPIRNNTAAFSKLLTNKEYFQPA